VCTTAPRRRRGSLSSPYLNGTPRRHNAVFPLSLDEVSQKLTTATTTTSASTPPARAGRPASAVNGKFWNENEEEEEGVNVKWNEMMKAIQMLMKPSYSRLPSFVLQPAHVKACFLGSNLTVPVTEGRLNLGTWQGVWLCEHRNRAGSRKVVVTVNGALKQQPQPQPPQPQAQAQQQSSIDLPLGPPPPPPPDVGAHVGGGGVGGRGQRQTPSSPVRTFAANS